MMSNLLTPEILAALAAQPRWTVITPSATSDAGHVDGVTAAPPSPTTGTPVVGRVAFGSTTQAPPEAARMMSGSTTAAPPDAAHVAPKCPRCGGTHRLEQCPQVKSIEYYPDGSVRRVEFHESPRPSEPSAPWWGDNSSWVVAARGKVCPKCDGIGRVPFFLPLAQQPMRWDTCDQCHGHGMVWDWSPSSTSTSSTGSWSSVGRQDEEE